MNGKKRTALRRYPAVAPTFARDVSGKMRSFVFNCNDFVCQMCGAESGEIDPYDPPNRISLHFTYLVDKRLGGLDDPTNLRPVCSICREGFEKLKIVRPTAPDLLIQTRRATGGDQVEVLRWLVRKYPKEAAKVLLPRE